MTDETPSRQIHVVDISVNEGVVTARVVGPVIEAHRAEALTSAVRDALDQHADGLKSLVLDFEEVTFVNSTGLAACLTLARLAREAGAEAIASNVAAPVAETFRMIKGDRLIRFE